MEEREIDLLDMIADILSHWRGLLAALIIGAVLMGGLSECAECPEGRQAGTIGEGFVNAGSTGCAGIAGAGESVCATKVIFGSFGKYAA